MKITHYLEYEPLAIQARKKARRKAHHQKIKRDTINYATTYIAQLTLITLMLSPLLIIMLYQTA